MDKAKAAVSSFISKSGHHDTTVHETVAPSVQKETVNEVRKEETQVARDREIHQDHYHTSVQPIKHEEVLPEQHHHKVAGVEHKTFDNRDHSATKEKLQHHAGQFQNESVRASAQHTSTTAAPEVIGEHIHHHVHETIQPVIHKQTIEPHVTHTTIPVHETHYREAEHHSASTLPTVNLSEFKNQGGVLGGRAEQHDHFAGEPRTVGSHGHGHGHTSHTNTNTTSYSEPATHNQTTGSHVGAGVGSNVHGDSHHSGTTHGKPSLMDKLNPMKDSNGDGQKGFMK